MKQKQSSEESKKAQRIRSLRWYEKNRELTIQRTKEWKLTNPEKFKIWKEENYENYKPRQKILNKTRREEKHDEIKIHKKEYYDNLRKTAIFHYSNGKNMCAICSESTYQFLCLDHINNDGAKHRKIDKIKGSSLFVWLYKNNYPPTFQILCYNCNYLKSLKPRSNPKTKMQEYHRKSIDKLRHEIIYQYSEGSMKCAICNHNDYRVLTIDHINGGGRQHVKQIGGLYTWLRNNGYPEGYRVLCMNCNCSRIYTPKYSP